MTMDSQPKTKMESWEARLLEIARSTKYPTTPDIAEKWVTRSRTHSSLAQITPKVRLSWAAVAAIVALATLTTITPIRAAIVEWLQLGAIWIQVGDDRNTIELPAGYGSDFIDLLDTMSDPTTLAEAARSTSFTLQTPTLLPEPDGVYQHHVAEMTMITLVWNGVDNTPDAVLQILGPGGWAYKAFPVEIANAQVNGAEAVWTTGPYLVFYPDGMVADRHLVANHALIWQMDESTYRFESALDMETAVRIAESLAPIAVPVSE